MSKSYIPRILSLAAAVALTLPIGAAQAATTAPASFTVTATLANFCTISAGNVGFGAVNAGAAATNTSANISLTCNKGATVTVALNNGANAVGTQKRMTNGTDNLNYNIDVPTGLATCPAAGAGPEWNATNLFSATSSFTATGGLKQINICASIPALQYPSAGSYTDTVQATATYN